MLALVILPGCGASGHEKAQWQAVSAVGFHFRAPKAWRVTTAADRTTARHDGDFVQVATFPLAHRYTDSLFARVQSELALRMDAVARAAKGTVTGHRVVTVDGTRSHVYDVDVGGRTERYTFVLRGRREFLLVCSADSAVCDELAASFVAG